VNLRYMAGVSPIGTCGRAHSNTRRAITSGEALDCHRISVHDGAFVPECPACKELKAKQDSARTNRI
jgi:hypothetical protein